MTASELRAFESEVAEAFKAKRIRGPVHLAGGNEEQLLEVFKEVDRGDYVLSTYRSHYHALLHGVPRAKVMERILSGRSMNLSFPEYRFLTSAIVGGMLPIAAGVASALKRDGSARKVWCFVGDMASTTGAFHEAAQYARGQRLPIVFVVENNELSCDTPTRETWGDGIGGRVIRYSYQRRYPHVGMGEFVTF